MPLYEFECSDCGEHMELIVKVNARAPKCPDCGGKLRKQVSAPAFQFKGSGWYVTDYAGKGKTSEPAKKEGAGNDSGSSSKEDKSDAGSSTAKDKKKSASKKKGGD